MKKLYSIIALLAATTALAQQPAADGPQTSTRVDACLQHAMKHATKQQLLSAIVSTTADARQVARQIVADGHRASAITSTTLTVRATADYLRQLSRREGVDYIKQSQQMQPLMEQARAMSNVDMVHSGEGLETPFTGRGVIIGVVDQGFEYRHIAFLDDKNQPRVRAIWNRWGYGEGKDGEPTTTIPATGDGITSTAHATHVAGIAAGSRISENPWYGIAPEAELLMVPSEFNTAEVLEDVRWIADMARSEGKPWVVNMSFGSNMGSHDGADPSFLPLDDIITEQPGGMIVAGIGNDGEQTIHASHTIGTGPASLLVQPGNYGVMVDLWCQTPDSVSHITIRPYIYDDGAREYLDDDIVEQIVTHEIAPFNKKEHYTIIAPAQAIRSYGNNAIMGIELTGDEGTPLHAWTTTMWGAFKLLREPDCIVPDNEYTVMQPAHAMRHGIAVTAYNSTKIYDNVKGHQQTSPYGEVGDICSFSNRGPVLHGTPQPTVAAPGAMIISSLSKYEQGFSKDAPHITGDVKRGLKHFYYGAYAGTSMATPMVTGSVALWLQANPQLTHEQIHQILRQSSHMPEGVETNHDGWNPQWGFGQLDTYEGLKLALVLAQGSNAIVALQGSQAPFTLKKQPGQWRILLNNSEPWATLTLSDLGGHVVQSRRMGAMQQGDEVVADFSRLSPGVYMLRLHTASADMIRKVVIR